MKNMYMYILQVDHLFRFLFAGLFRDIFGTFDEAFYFGGIGIFLGGVILLCGNVWKIIRDRRVKRAETLKGDKE